MEFAKRNATFVVYAGKPAQVPIITSDGVGPCIENVNASNLI
jgi:hypothetical protein